MCRSTSGSCSVMPSVWPAGRIVTWATGSACSDSAATRACPDSCTATACFSSGSSTLEPSRRPRMIRSLAASKSAAVIVSRLSRTAKMAASLARLARSAPENPGVPRAIAFRSTSPASFLPRQCTARIAARSVAFGSGIVTWRSNRPGRFDRQVTIPLPNATERAAILAVHCRGKKLAGDVDLNAIARGTPGFSGADLANLANEAAIFAVRDNRETITAADFDAARDRIILGRREGSNVLLPEEKHAVAVHESGHALVAALSPQADPVAKVTILPAGQALGVTEQLPLVERHMYGEDYLHDSLAVRLGGRAAELVVLGQGSTGAANDLAGATDLATKMVREFGLSAALGPVGYPQGGSVFLVGGGNGLSSRPYAEATQAAIDREVARLLREAEKRAVELIRAHRPERGQLVSLLLERETVDGTAVYGI